MVNSGHSQDDVFAGPPDEPKQRFFFDVYDGETTTVDGSGLELADLHTARQEAVAALAGIAKDALPDGVRRDFFIEVRDASGRKRLRASLSFVLETLG
jgi:hypothetical protein